jgi:hypothetical protein
MVGNLCPASFSRDGACGDGGKTFIPATGIAGIETHVAGARGEGRKRRLQEFLAIHLEGGDLSAEPGQDSDRAGAGPDENVFFGNAN